jgi:hypothetical protein
VIFTTCSTKTAYSLCRSLDLGGPEKCGEHPDRAKSTDQPTYRPEYKAEVGLYS